MLQRRDRGRRRVLAVTYRVSKQDELATEDVHNGQQKELVGSGLSAKTAQHERHGDAERAGGRQRRCCRQLRRDHDPVLRSGGYISARFEGQSAESSDGGSQRSRLRRYATAEFLGSTVGVFASSNYRSNTGTEPNHHGSWILSSVDTTGTERGSVS